MLQALGWALSKGYKKIKVYHDYEGVSKWITGDWECRLPVSQMYVYVYEKEFKEKMCVEFEKVPSHSNISYNDQANALAKSAFKK